MELRIYWTDFSKNELNKIFSYYKENANFKVAKNLILGIVNETTKLEAHPNIGQKEELLENREQEFRYLIYKNYKIIYWVNTNNNWVEISDVFDTRQNPVKVKTIK